MLNWEMAQWKMTYMMWNTFLPSVLLLSAPTGDIGEKVFLTALVGTEVLIPCQLTTGSGKLAQLSWIKDHQEEPIAVYSPRFGFNVPNENYSRRIELRNQSLMDGSIRIKALEMQDEGNYTCDLTTFPQGKLRKAAHLTILVVPTNIATSVPAKAGLSEVPVARCIAAFGNPAADITWKSSLHGNHTTVQTANSNGTVNVDSLYKMNPRRSDNGQTVTCIITHSATGSSNTYRIQLEIHYPPEVTITGYDQTWSENSRNVTVTCNADANPPVTTYTWRGLPEGAVLKDGVVFIGEMSAQANGNWTCEATNAIGTGVGRLEVLLRPSDADPPDNLKLIIIIAVIAGALVLVFILVLIWLKRRRRETEAHSQCTSFQTQGDETIVYASLDLHALNEASVHRQHGQAEESIVYAAIKHH